MVHIYEPLKNGFAWGPESREGKYIPEYMLIPIRISMVEGSDIITLSPSDMVGQLKGLYHTGDLAVKWHHSLCLTLVSHWLLAASVGEGNFQGEAALT